MTTKMLRRRRRRRALLGLAAAAAVATGPGAVGAADAVGGYTISGGPWNLRGCSSTVCPRVGSIGNGAIPDLVCQAKGEWVTLSASVSSNVWDKVRTADGTVGFVTDLAVNETEYRRYDTRLPHCSGTANAVAYYQPRFSRGDPIPVANVLVPRDAWSNGSCAPASGYSVPEVTVSRTVTTLSGWSLGRLGPTYLMYWNPERMKGISSVVLYDPGSYEDYFGSGSCDPSYDQSGLYKTWLSSNSANRLLILAGEHTKDVGSAHNGYAHRGIQEALFSKIRGTAQAKQVLVCNYDDLDHFAVVNKFPRAAEGGPRSSCPTADGVRLYAAWHP